MFLTNGDEIRSYNAEDVRMQDAQWYKCQENVGGSVGGQQHAVGEQLTWQFKLDPLKLFEGKTVDGSLLESWLY